MYRSNIYCKWRSHTITANKLTMTAESVIQRFNLVKESFYAFIVEFQRIHPSLRPCATFHNMPVFHSKELLAPDNSQAAGPSIFGCL
jgi:hypothetical protein